MKAEVFFKLTKEQEKAIYPLELRMHQVNKTGQKGLIMGQEVNGQVGFSFIEHDTASKIIELLDPELYKQLVELGEIVIPPKININIFPPAEPAPRIIMVGKDEA